MNQNKTNTEKNEIFYFQGMCPKPMTENREHGNVMLHY